MPATSGSTNTTSVTGILVDWDQALVTGSITGLFTFLALFGANSLLDVYTGSLPV